MSKDNKREYNNDPSKEMTGFDELIKSAKVAKRFAKSNEGMSYNNDPSKAEVDVDELIESAKRAESHSKKPSIEASISNEKGLTFNIPVELLETMISSTVNKAMHSVIEEYEDKLDAKEDYDDDYCEDMYDGYDDDYEEERRYMNRAPIFINIDRGNYGNSTSFDDHTDNSSRVSSTMSTTIDTRIGVGDDAIEGLGKLLSKLFS